MRRIVYQVVLLGLIILVTQCKKVEPKAGFYDADIVSISNFIFDSTSVYTKFGEILTTAGMVNALNSYNPGGHNFTLFLPTNDAIDRFIENNDDYANFNELLSDTDYVTSLARYHLVMLELKTNDFPFGALPDTTASGDYLTIGINIEQDGSTYIVNNEAPIIEPNIELINGVIHVIDEVLEPVVLSSYSWLRKEEGFSILAEAFNVTGLKDTMGIFSISPDGTKVENVYTLLVEHDSVFNKRGIYTVQDLIDTIVGDPNRDNYTSVDNPLYQFAAYHILENRYFLDALVSSNYNTYANYPVSITSGLDIQVNKGSRVYDTIINNTDTVIVDYIKILIEKSNVLTKNGAIHFVDQMLELYQPRAASVSFQFTNEEPVLDKIRYDVGEHVFYSDNEFTALKWEGVKEMVYIKSASSSEVAWNKDYIRFDGDFKVYYTIPKVLAGNYEVRLLANSSSSKNAIVQVFIDGKRIGSNFDLRSGGNPYAYIKVGKVTFSTSEKHLIEIRALVPGIFEWDAISFNP